MKKFQIDRVEPFVKYPKLHYMYAGYKGFDRGLQISWLNRMITIIRPINERD